MTETLIRVGWYMQSNWGGKCGLKEEVGPHKGDSL